MRETNLRQIEVLTNAWDTISNILILEDSKLREKQNIILNELTVRILKKVDIYLKSGQE